MPHLRLNRRLLAAAGAALLTVGGCGAGAGEGPGDRLTVFAAASLTEAFTEIGRDFEQAHPGLTVRFNFAGSSSLAQQLSRGAPADVFASANEKQMARVADEGLVEGEPTAFTRNRLQIVVPKRNPAGVRSLAAFGKEDLTLAVCAEEVPCGAAARKAFDVAGVDAKPDTLERDVKAVLTKVRLGEADAGLVYRTDMASAEGTVEGVDFPEAGKAVNEYPIAALSEAPNGTDANAFVDYVRSSAGQRVLREFGFTTVGG